MPEVDKDGDILFKREGSQFYIDIVEDDESPMYVTLSMAFSKPEKYSLNQMKIAAANINLYKGVKVLVYDEYFSIQSETFLMSSEQFKYTFYTMMSQILNVAGNYDEECSKAPSYASNSSSYSQSYGSSSTSTSHSNSSSSAMSISKTSISLNVGQTESLHAYNYGSSLEWESDNTNIATVSRDGVVRGVSAGSTNIWAKGKEYKVCRVNVNAGSSYSSSYSSYSSSDVRTIYSKEVAVKVGQKIRAQLSEGKVTYWEIEDYNRNKFSASGDVLTIHVTGNVNVWGYINGSPKLFKFTVSR